MERRTFLKSTGALAAGLAASRNAFSPDTAAAFGRSGKYSAKDHLNNFSKGVSVPLEALSSDLTPYSGAWTDVQLLHLLRRSMFGVPFAQLTEAKALGSMSAVVNKLTDLSAPLPPKPAAWVGTYLSPVKNDMIASQSNQRLELVRSQEVVNWWFDLMVKEDLSIREKMTLLWSNHFVTGTIAVQHAGFTYQYNQLLRQFALGNLKQFVSAISVDPSMLVYLNGNQSYAKNVNENYARELMELFTLGLVDPKTGQPNYTETDIQNSAKSLTGWVPTIVPNASEPYFTGTLYPSRHDGSTNAYLGTQVSTLPNVIDAIFSLGNGYNVAWFISQNLYANFVYYDTSSTSSQGVIDAMAKLLLASNWELKPVVQALLSSSHFYDPNVIGSQLKSPTEFLAGLARDFGVTYAPFDPTDPPPNGVDAKGITKYTDPNLYMSVLTNTYGGSLLGQQLLNPPNVKGWPGGENWISSGTFPGREAIAAGILKSPANVNYKFDGLAWAKSYPGATSMSATEITAAFTTALLALPLGPIETAALQSLIDPNPQDFYLDAGFIAQFASALALLPEFQLN
jgi:uncharacterized protein (DUF1800 family)